MSSPTHSPPQSIQSQPLIPSHDSPPPIQSQEQEPPFVQSQPPPLIQSQDSPPQQPPQSPPQPQPQPQPQPLVIESQPQTPPSPPMAIPTQTPPPTSPPPSPPPQPPPPPPPPPQPPIIQALSYSPLKKPQPIPWSHEETINLIKAYQEKWYSLKRGQLKASQWEEVAITIAARCGLDEPSKSGTQCRHKIEKLRKRYRAEKLKLPPNFNYHNSHHPWIYYSLMDQLERGPMPISAIAPTIPKNENNDSDCNEDNDNEDDDDYGGKEDEERGGVRYASLRKLKGENRVDGFFRIGRTNLGDFGNGFGKRSDFEGGSFRDLKNRKNFYEQKNNNDNEEENQGFEEDEDEDERGRRKRGNLVGELAAEIRGFAEKFVRIEKKKLDLMRENQRFRNEMENKRMEMIYISQQRTVELINKAFDVASSSSAHKKMKMNSEL